MSVFTKMLTYIKRKNNIRQWRKLNGHNDTYPMNSFAFSNVSVGNGTYGELTVCNDDITKVIIGNYVSIGGNVIFLAGLEHRQDTISTFPFKVKLLKTEESEAFSKGDIVVNDDVWISDNVLIMSNVTIGQGAIVAAGAVVTKDVPPYAIVGGVPARIIKYRFEKELRDKLKKIDFSKIDKNYVRENIEDFYEAVTIENIDRIIKELPQK